MEEKIMKENKSFLVISGIISGLVQISIIIGMLVLPNITFNSTSINSFSENILKQEYSSDDDSQYSKNYISGFFKNKQSSKSGSSKEIILYNGITIDEGIKSNENINNKAVELTKNATSDRERAKILYTWVGSNIKYDNDKAEKVLNGSDTRKMPDGGAICAFENKSGICFDKACLYVAMSRAIGLKVRLIGGQAFDGEQYAGHAWNQVYLNDENIWINVDSTFYDGGNYFDSNLFNNHNVEEIAGEW
jgi:transglutaminase-like putative cysteine protease